MSTTFKEVMEAVTAKQHELRVYEFLAEQLRPFTDMDVGRRRQLEAEGCLVPFVPTTVVMHTIRDLAKKIQTISAQIEELQQVEAVAAPSAAPAQAGPPKVRAAKPAQAAQPVAPLPAPPKRTRKART